ncbi:MAG TPA: histidine phosphatase family protein [Blastocatellia bacterium]|nr:histidine phosphatase family protein [Blastocatellia bacterium]
MIYFIRHAPAGPRGNYDELSLLGVRQAQQLGLHFAQQQLRFDVIYTGSLQRQQETARLVNEQLTTPTDVCIDARWNEFQLGTVYQSIAAHLCAEDERFAQDLAEMKVRLKENAYAMSGAIARCDRAIMKAWLEDRYPAQDYEPWSAFQARVQAACATLRQHSYSETIAVFTSATPIAIAAGMALQLSEERVLGLAWVMYNASVTTVKWREEALQLYTLNAASHLPEKQRTFR